MNCSICGKPDPIVQPCHMCVLNVFLQANEPTMMVMGSDQWNAAEDAIKNQLCLDMNKGEAS